jgi:putative endonuclease
MYYVYLLKSAKDNRYYVGYTEDLKQRFIEHQKGKVRATKDRRPLELFYYEAYSDRKTAQERERKLKQFGSAYHGLLKRL